MEGRARLRQAAFLECCQQRCRHCHRNHLLREIAQPDERFRVTGAHVHDVRRVLDAVAQERRRDLHLLAHPLAEPLHAPTTGLRQTHPLEPAMETAIAAFQKRGGKVVATGKIDNYGPRTAFEYIMVTWTFYVLLMLAYDEQLFGAYSWFTYLVFFASFSVFFYLCYKLLGYDKFGANLKYSIPTVTILWNDVEILAKWGMLKEPWVHINWPIMSVIIGGFAVSTYLIINDLRKRKQERIESKDIV